MPEESSRRGPHNRELVPQPIQSAVSGRFCGNCGRSIPVDSRLCPYCGTRVGSLDLGPGPPSDHPRMSRAGTLVFMVIAVGVLALGGYIYVVQHDATALLFAIFIVILLYVVLAIFRPRGSGPPA